MVSKIKKYLEYRKNKKTVKKELARIGANIMPIIGNASVISRDIILFITKLSNELNNVGGEKFVEMLLSQISEVLQSDNKRIVEVFTYIAQLSPKEMQKIITDAVVETMSETNN